ncbi:MAG: flavin reductase family protein [Azospirillaceae bacterium]|nr:flavin reductase family protein [Azospirillaceae bacterium]
MGKAINDVLRAALQVLPPVEGEELVQKNVADGLKAAMRRLAAGVAVITLADGEGLAGTTVSSLTSLCLDPPAVLFCLNQGASLHDRLLRADTYAVNLLSAGQEEVSQRFAAAGPDRFTPGAWETVRGAPCLKGAQANLVCRLAVDLPFGTHRIIVGKVLWTRVREQTDPLLYADGAYRVLG